MGNITPHQGIEAALHITARLSQLWMWMLIAVAHLALCVMALACLWWFQVQPSGLLAAAQRVIASRPVGAFLFLGGSIATAAGLYWKLAAWIHRASSRGWLYGYLTKGLF